MLARVSLARSRHNFRMQYFYENHHFLNEASVALNPFMSLLLRVVAENVVTDTHTHTDTQTKYCNPHSSCAPRVNNLPPNVSTLVTHYILSVLKYIVWAECSCFKSHNALCVGE